MSDVILYPIRGQVAQVNGKSEYIVYVPRADKYTYGTVKLGDGLLINSETGAVDFDRSEIKILEIKKNGVKIDPVDKVVNITMSKEDVGLSNVDNTSDEDKLASKDVRDKLTALEHNLTDDIMNVEEHLDNYKIEVNGLLDTAAAEVDRKLDIVNNTITTNKNSVDTELLKLNDLVKGKDIALAYKNYSEVVNEFNAAATNKYKVGQTVFVQDTMVPDLWVYSVENTHVDFAYIGDDNIVEMLTSAGTVQFGYYKLAMMETKTTSIGNVVTLDTEQTITADKTYRVGTTYAVIGKDYVTLQNKKAGASRTNYFYASNGKTLFGSMDNYGGTSRGIEHDAETATTTLSGVVKYNGSDIATLDNFKDSDSIVVSKDALNNVKFELDAEVQSKLGKVLITPMSRPTSTELVAIDNTNSQKMIEIGDGLSLENGVLKATGGGGSGDVDVSNLVTLDGSQTITGRKSFTDGIHVNRESEEGASYRYSTTMNLDDNEITITSRWLDASRKAYVKVKGMQGVFLGSTNNNGGDFKGVKIDTTGLCTYNDSEVATKQDIETNIISALNTEV